MSNIPEARRILTQLREHELECGPYHIAKVLHEVLKLLDRKKPAFRARSSVPALTDDQRTEARRLRSLRKPVNEIARILGTNQGRVSEAINT